MESYRLKKETMNTEIQLRTLKNGFSKAQL